MKNKFLVSLFVLSSISLTAFADGRCGRPNNAPCSQFYSRFDAFKKLRAAENSDDDATGNLDFLEAHQRGTGLPLHYLVDNFLYLQTLLGGSQATEKTRQTFSLVIRQAEPVLPLDELLTVFSEIRSNENELGDAQEDFSVVLRAVKSGQLQLAQSLRTFLSLLRLEGGANGTAKAQNDFAMLLGYVHEYPMHELFRSFQQLMRSENERGDAIEDFELVILAARKCGSLTRATGDFLDVLKQVGGANSTKKAQELFRKLYGI